MENLTITKEEAIKLMQRGEKVTHELFSVGEWVTEENGLIVSEDGVKHYGFWELREADHWDTGWSIYN